MDDEGQKQLEIITHDQNGMILCSDKVTGDFGRNFSTIIGEDFINKNQVREFSIITMDDKGNILATHHATSPVLEQP